MIKFEIDRIDNGFVVRGDMGWHQDSKGDYVDDFTLYAASLPDAFATIATKCDNLMDDEIAKADQDRDDNTDELPF